MVIFAECYNDPGQLKPCRLAFVVGAESTRDLLPGSIENSIEKLEVFGTKSTIANTFVCFHGYCPKAVCASIGVSLDAEISCVS